MMNLSDLKTSKFLKKEDVGAGALATIHAVSQQNVAMEGAEPDMRAVVHFNEFEKPMVLNSTNGQIIAKIAGVDENIETAWRGVRVVLYNDPNVSFGGKLVGGIRVRAPRPGAKLPAVPAAQEFDGGVPIPEDDGLPF
jgi:hypothetical protein